MSERQTNNAEREDADESLRKTGAELYKDYNERVTVAVEKSTTKKLLQKRGT